MNPKKLLHVATQPRLLKFYEYFINLLIARDSTHFTYPDEKKTHCKNAF